MNRRLVSPLSRPSRCLRG